VSLFLLACATAPSGPTGRVVVVGMDGLEYTLLDRMGEALPHFAKLLREGARGEMHVPPPIMSPILWTSIASGYPVEVHGVGGWNTGKGHAFSGADVRVRRVWDVVSAAGGTVGVSGWLMTWPVGPVRGWLLSDKFVYSFPLGRADDVPTPSDTWGTTFPQALATESFRPDPAWLAASPVGYQLDAYPGAFHPLTHDEPYLRAFLAKWPNSKAHFGAVYLNGADQVSHVYWPFTEPTVLRELAADPAARAQAIAESGKPAPYDGPLDSAALAEAGRWVPDYYRYLDQALGRVMAVLEPDTTLVLCSDHGFKLATAAPLLRGSHHEIAVFAVWGPHARGGARAAMDVLDAAPTLYALLGLPAAADMTGHVAGDLVDVAAVAPVATYRLERSTAEPAASPETLADVQLREQLQALGYLDEDGRPDVAVGGSRRK
jgi:hypothetical protein